jgi:hypothetical protein
VGEERDKLTVGRPALFRQCDVFALPAAGGRPGAGNQARNHLSVSIVALTGTMLPARPLGCGCAGRLVGQVGQARMASSPIAWSSDRVAPSSACVFIPWIVAA